MKQLIQDLKSGNTILEEVPAPAIRPGYILIKSHRSLVSVGTEKMLVEFGKANYLEKARQQPEKVKQVISKIKSDGLRPTVDAVFRKLNQPLPLGYSNAGEVIKVGKGVSSIQVGDKVISNGHHAEFVCVPENLCAKIPESVTYDEASFTVIGAIALQGIRLLQPEIGQKTVVIGLGLIGLLACQILQANGAEVIGVDIDDSRIQIAKDLGIQAYNSDSPASLIVELTNNIGADAVLITASSSSDTIVSQAAQMCRRRGKIVLLGVIGLSLNRSDFYEKEISFQVSCSYGPGRYDTQYEEKGLDYPIGFVRWTEKRNFQTVLQLLDKKKINVNPLISQQVKLEDYQLVYDKLGSSIASILQYDTTNQSYAQTLEIAHKSISPSTGVIAVIGAGNFTSGVVCPALAKTPAKLKTIVSADGLHAARLAKKYKASHASSDYALVLADESIDAVVIATRHNLHAEQIQQALAHNKHVFVEKPLCLNETELSKIISVHQQSDATLTVGYNRRFSPFILQAKSVLNESPLNIIMTINAGHIAPDHWTQDSDIGGGRIIGELCHFIDLAIHLTNSHIKAVVMNRTHNEDNVNVLLEFVNGSQAAIQYFPTGHKSLSKERIEIHQLGNSIIIDNFQSIKYYGFKKKNMSKSQDKGHQNQFARFVDSIMNGNAPTISFKEIVHVSKVIFAAIESAQLKQWVTID